GTAARRCGLLRVELDDELFLHLRVDLLTLGQGVHEDAEVRRDDLEPRRNLALAGLGVRDDERRHLAGLVAHLDDVVGRHPVARDVDLLAVDGDVTVAHQLAGHVAALGQTRAVHHVVQTALEDRQQVLTCLALLAVGLFVVVAELLLEDAVDARALLLLALLQQVLALLGPVPAVLAGRVGALLDRACRRIALGSLEEQLGLFAAAPLAVRPGITCHLLLTPGPQTRRRLGGRQPLWGTGVTSWIVPTSRPVACSERMAVSRPDPGPLTNTSTLRMP